MGLQDIIKYIKRHDIDANVMFIGGSLIGAIGMTYTFATVDLTGLLGLAIGTPIGLKGLSLEQNYYYSEPLGHRVRVICKDPYEKQKYIEHCKAQGF